MVNTFFQNHEIVKISLEYPVLTPVIIYCLLLLLIFYRRKKNEKKSFLCRQVTDELRGLAILLVVVGHLGFHTLEARQQIYFPVLGQYGVSIFFLLSGFGLTRSYVNRPLLLTDFFIRRLSKIMIPYWIATVVIVLIDSIFLDKSYCATDILLTMVGFNSSSIVRSIDYVRWYVTVLLFWYILFALCWKINSSRNRKIVYFFSVGALLVFNDYYLFSVGYGYLSFPFGVLVGLYYDEIRNCYNHMSRKRILSGAIAAITANWLFQSYFVDRVDIFMPTIGMAFIAEFSWLIVASSLAIVCSLLMPSHSPLLSIFGKYSYGIFLFHGALMVKYDFILFRSYLFITFWIYLALVVFFSIFMEDFVFKKVSGVRFIS